MKGILTDCYTGFEKEIELEYKIEMDNDNKRVFYLLNGVTGFESFYVCDDTIQRMNKKDWCACAGTKPVGTAPGWDKLVISTEEMKKMFQEEGII